MATAGFTIADVPLGRHRDGWNPRPIPDGTKFNDAAYLCGYTDGFFGCSFGEHDKGRYGAFSAYRTGYGHGRSDTAGQVPA